ncbi:alpha/beta hydrolase [Jannaschia rubra]|uniref:alpha/beta hydrolase n=1 Tax=Jannaschia rubra TaxID=282197 RepID=UPI0024909D90|nr:alpha/beta hydrolase [Jannaschia rubra]
MIGWQEIDRATLDAAYANADHIANSDAFPPRWRAEAAAFREATRADLDLAYADRPGATLDLFHPEGPARGLTVFLHGGYWRSLGKSDWSHLASGAVTLGQAVAVVGYPLAPQVRIGEITRLVARAVDHAAARVSGPIHLTGHSAGGHLAARMVMADAAPACAHRIASCVPISPLSDLRPLTALGMNDDWRLDAAEATAESPALGHPMPGPRLAVHVGAAERPSFLWQSEVLARAWGIPLRRVPGRHHFDVIDALTDPRSDLLADLLG